MCCSIEFSQELCEVVVFVPILQMEKPKPREFEELAEGWIAMKEESQGLA